MKRFLFGMIALFLAVSVNAQITFKPSMTQTAPDEITISFAGTIGSGWHVYSPAEKNGPIPATFNIDKIEGCKLVGGLTANKPAITKYEDMFGADVSYYEHSVTFSQKIKLTGKTYLIEGYLEYGACNDQSCLPPTAIDVKYSGKGVDAPAKQEAKEESIQENKEEKTDEKPQDGETAMPADSVVADSASVQESSPMSGNDLWTPVIDELKSFGESNAAEGRNLLTIFLLGLLGGFIALFTPCVWPIIPMTVSFFLKRNKDDKSKGVREAMTYGASIVVIYVVLGLAVTLLFGANALNSLSTNAVFNIFFCLMLLVFAASFLGGFEITLPSSWSNAVDSKAGKTSGLLSIFLMAFTLALVSFSCTGPIIGFLLVEMATSGSVVGPTIGMFGFALALALPFTLFALFPAWLKSAPKSGNWMNAIKVTLGFLELAFALKFLSVADLAYGWRILDREVFLCLWIVIFAMLGAYHAGWIRFPHDEEEWDEMGEKVLHHKTSVPQFFIALVSFAFAIYMIPGLWGAPCKAVSAFAPPMTTQDFNLAKSESIEAEYKDFDKGMQAAIAEGKPVMIDFTGFGCVNCRKMEAAVWTNERVKELINEDYVLIQLFVDDKTPLAEPVEVTQNGQTRKLRTVGDKWSYLQSTKFGAQAQPFYVLLDHKGHPLNHSASYDEDIDKYIDFLETGLKNFKK